MFEFDMELRTVYGLLTGELTNTHNSQQHFNQHTE